MSDPQKEPAVLSTLMALDSSFTVSDGTKVTMHTLKLVHVAKLIPQLKELWELKKQGMGIDLMIQSGLSSFLEILPFCTDYPVEQISFTDAPKFLQRFLSMNLTDETIKNWTTLIETVIEDLTVRVDSATKDIKKTAKKVETKGSNGELPKA